VFAQDGVIDLVSGLSADDFKAAVAYVLTVEENLGILGLDSDQFFADALSAAVRGVADLADFKAQLDVAWQFYLLDEVVDKAGASVKSNPGLLTKNKRSKLESLFDQYDLEALGPPNAWTYAYIRVALKTAVDVDLQSAFTALYRHSCASSWGDLSRAEKAGLAESIARQYNLTDPVLGLP
jgi:hypothetical protein